MTGTFTPTKTEIRELPDGEWVELPDDAIYLLKRDPKTRRIGEEFVNVSTHDWGRQTYVCTMSHRNRVLFARIRQESKRMDWKYRRWYEGRDKRKRRNVRKSYIAYVRKMLKIKGVEA